MTPHHDTTQLVAASWLKAKPGRRDELIALLAELARGIHAEPGCVHYSVHRAPSDDHDGPLLLLQAYASHEALEAHGARIKGELTRIGALLESTPTRPVFYESLWLGAFATKESFAK